MYLWTSQELQYTLLLKDGHFASNCTNLQTLVSIISEKNTCSFGISLKNVCTNVSKALLGRLLWLSLSKCWSVLTRILHSHSKRGLRQLCDECELLSNQIIQSPKSIVLCWVFNAPGPLNNKNVWISISLWTALIVIKEFHGPWPGLFCLLSLHSLSLSQNSYFTYSPCHNISLILIIHSNVNSVRPEVIFYSPFISPYKWLTSRVLGTE